MFLRSWRTLAVPILLFALAVLPSTSFAAPEGAAPGAAPAAGADGADGAAAPGPLARMDKAMLGVGAHVQNAKAGIKRGTVGVGRPGSETGYTTFAAGCCASHIETIKTKMVAIQQDLELVNRYYTERQNATALVVVKQMDERLRQVAQAVLSFARALDKDGALKGLEGVVQPWNEFRNGIEILEGCCPITEGRGPTPPVEPSVRDAKD
jgi:hypothetical protein